MSSVWPFRCTGKCFHRAALKWHPDKNSSAEAKAHFQQISDAYTLLIERALSGASGVAAGANLERFRVPLFTHSHLTARGWIRRCLH